MNHFIVAMAENNCPIKAEHVNYSLDAWQGSWEMREPVTFESLCVNST